MTVISFLPAALSIHHKQLIEGLLATGRELILIKTHETPDHFLHVLELIGLQPSTAEKIMDLALAPADQHRTLAPPLIELLIDEGVLLSRDNPLPEEKQP